MGIIRPRLVFLIILKRFVDPWVATKIDTLPIIRMNPGILRIFELRKWKVNLNGSDFRASKMISNDTEPEPISWETNIKNKILKFFRGCRRRWASQSKIPTYIKRCAIEFHIFWYQCRHRVRQRKRGFEWKKIKNWKLRGLKLRGLRRNQISTPHFIYKNDQYNKINTGWFLEWKTHAYGCAHANSKVNLVIKSSGPQNPKIEKNFEIILHIIRTICNSSQKYRYYKVYLPSLCSAIVLTLG